MCIVQCIVQPLLHYITAKNQQFERENKETMIENETEEWMRRSLEQTKKKDDGKRKKWVRTGGGG